MTVLVLTIFLLFGAYIAGLLGALTGLGGGVVIIPLLTIVLGIDIHYAIGASLVSVIATSSGAAAAYVKEGITNIRVGMFLEIATTIGAITGAVLATYVPANFIAILFGLILIFSVVMTLRGIQENISTEGSVLAGRLKMHGSFPGVEGPVNYGIRNVAGGFGMMTFAGIISGLLGIGSGALKVIAMDVIMRIPFKVSTTTSNFMIGVTATASAVIYLQRGYVDPGLCFPVVVGVVLGALTGSRILVKAQSRWLRIIFSLVISFLAYQMIYNGIKHMV